MEPENSRETLSAKDQEINKKNELQNTATQNRLDPYKNFKFRIKWDGRYVAGISKMSGLKRTTQVVEHREGADPSSIRKSPGQTSYQPITLERGLTHDLEFENWAQKVSKFDPKASLDDFRKDIILELLNEAGQVVLRYKVYSCWVSEYQALPDLDANANAVAIETIKIENEGWERDSQITEPTEPGI